MSRVFVRTAAALIVVGAAVAVFVAASLPAARVELAAPVPGPGTVRGAIHVHSNRSDGRGTPDEIAGAAARAGLKFLVLTDHGDATRPPDPPTYRSGVLCLDGVEISTTGGHYVAIDMPAAPYPLGGEARDVVDDVRRLGGFGIVTHPDSPKPELQWREWDAPFDAIELLNPDTSWRKRAAAAEWTTRGALVRALFTYPFRPEESVAQFLTLSDALVTRWTDLLRDRPVVAIAGVDAHAKLALRDVDPGDNRLSLPFPGYEALFRTLSLHVFNDQPFSGDALADAKVLLRALRAGRLFVAADGLASPPGLDFIVSSGGGSARAGEQLALAGDPTVSVRTNAPATYDTQVWHNGDVTGSSAGPLNIPVLPVAAAVWVQVRANGGPDSPVWLVSNPVYVGDRPRESATAPGDSEQGFREPRRWLVDDAAIGTWTTEHDPASRASLTVTALGSGPELAFDYALAEQGAAMPFAALAVFTRGGALDGMGAVQFTARADRPMRVSVQLRAAEHQTADHRWHRSVYVDGRERPYRIPFDDFRPIGGTRIPQPLLAGVHSIVFVVDTTNTRPGSEGRLALTRVGLE